jgi:arginyl-tRNA synthetase
LRGDESVGAWTSTRRALPETIEGSSRAARYNPPLCRTPRIAANPLTDLKSQLAEWLSAGLARVAPGHAPQIALERPKQSQYGDYSSNVALQLARALKRNPRDLAAALIAALEPIPQVARVELAGAGFINVFLSDSARREVIVRILDERDAFGSVAAAQGASVIVEFVSANPTGPLHVGHGRGAAVGDAIARLVASQGYRVHREFYYNDAGAQIANLVLSVQARVREAAGASAPFPADGYQGEYVREIARAYLEQRPHDAAGDDLDAIRSFAVGALRREQDADLSTFGVRFDQYFLE